MDLTNEKSRDKRLKTNDNRPHIVHANDVNQALKYNQYQREESITKQYERKNITIMDLPLSTIVDKTLNFVVYAGDDFYDSIDLMKSKVGDKESTNSSRFYIYFLSFFEFCRRSDNLIYLGIWLVLFSIIIYFLNITISK